MRVIVMNPLTFMLNETTTKPSSGLLPCGFSLMAALAALKLVGYRNLSKNTATSC